MNQIIHVRQDDLGKIEDFFRLTTEVYKGNQVWIPESIETLRQEIFTRQETDKLRFPLLCLVNNKPVARAVAMFHPKAKNERGECQGWIGFFEALPGHDESVKGLLRKAEEILRDLGAVSILAPKTDNQMVGFLADGFDLPQTVLTGYNPPYYIQLFEAFGYSVKTKSVAYNFTRKTVPKLHIEVPGIVTRVFNRSDLPREIERFNQIQKEIFSCRNGYIPRTLAEDEKMILSMLSFLDDDLIIFAEDHNGTPIGILLCLPDINQVRKGEKITRARIISIGAVPSWQKRGVGKAMAFHLMKNLLQKDYQEAEASWILEHNTPPKNLALRFSARLGRVFVLMEKLL